MCTLEDALHHLKRMQRHLAGGTRLAALLERVDEIHQTDTARVLGVTDRIERMAVRHDRPRRVYVLRTAFGIRPAVLVGRKYSK